MATKEELISDKMTHLSEKRTQLAYERTILAYLRTAATVILFGIAFLGFSKAHDLFFYTGVASISAGAIFLVVAFLRGVKHSNELNRISTFFERMRGNRLMKKKRKV